jgi:hypothetical protein
MRCAVLVAVVGIIMGTWAGAGFGTTGSGTATASFVVDVSISANVHWVGTGTDAIDFGMVPAGTPLSDELFLHVMHNMGSSQQFQLSAQVSKLDGAYWEDEITLYDYVERLGWSDTDFGTAQAFSTPIGGSTQNFSISLPTTIEINGQQAADSYWFEFTLIVTSL